MLAFFTELGPSLALTLLLSMGFVLVFEFINGFHDTANAVATVIYTHSMKPRLAVLISGISNFVGVLCGGLAVAYAIVHLLPIDLLTSVDTALGKAMVFSLLAAAIIWNLGTWYFGLPASSSHTLIGAILGVGVANSLINHTPLDQGINWDKAIDVGLSLLCSPLVGFIVSAFIVLCLRHWHADSNVHKTPFQRHEMDGRKHPPFWTRFMLVVSAMGVSFVHGSNDGQKGVGLAMLVLIGIVPAHYVINLDSTPYKIERTRDATLHLQNFYLEHQDAFKTAWTLSGQHPAQDGLTQCHPTTMTRTADELIAILNHRHNYHDLHPAQRWDVRTKLLCLDYAIELAHALPNLTLTEQRHLKNLRDDLSLTTHYAPAWVIISVALALSIGTTIGWRRVAKTVGEGIGKKQMTYAQGLSAQITAALSIGLASQLGMPVSTTQVLSSGVAGAMIADKAGLQLATIRAILLAWVFTLPIAMLLSGGVYYLAALWVG